MGIFKGPGNGRAFGGFVANDEGSLRRGLQKELGRLSNRSLVLDIGSIGLVGTQTFSKPSHGKKFSGRIKSK